MNKPFLPLSREEIAIRALGLKRDPLAGELIALEPRMVFDGAGVAIVGEAIKQAADTSDVGQTDSTAKSAAELTKMMAGASVPTTAAAPAPVEVVFIDSRVSDIDAFKKTAGDNRLVVVVDAAEDGITKITDTLKGLHDISAVHIVGHGKSGAFELGKDWIGVDAIKAHDVDLRAWSDSLSKGADILLYGCDIAKDGAGENFLKAIATETGADVAASADGVGKTDHGADWSLEKKTGDIEAKVLAPENYDAQLAEVVLVFIDKRVANYQAFANLATSNGYNVFYFENGDDPFKVMDAKLKTFSGITQVHLIAPGTTGGFVAGSALVDTNYISVNTNKAFLNSWGQYFANGADFLIYGNKVAGDTSNQFIKNLKGYLGVAVDVAASADDMGVTNNTPDWTLEKSVVSGQNKITSTVLAPSGYAGTLAPGSFYGDPFTRFTYGGTFSSPWYEGTTTFTSTTTSLTGRVTDPTVLATLSTGGWSIVAYNTADNTETTIANSGVNSTNGVINFNPTYNYTPFSKSTTNAVVGSVNLGFFFRDSSGNRVDVKGSDGNPLIFTINMNAPAAAPIVGIFASVDGSGNPYPTPVQAAIGGTIYDSSPFLIVSGDFLNANKKVVLKVNQNGVKTTYVYDNLTGTPAGSLVGKVSTRVDPNNANQVQTLFEIPTLSAGSYTVECQVVELINVNGTLQYGFSNNQASRSFTVDAGKPTFMLRDSFGVSQTDLTMDSSSDAFQTVDSVSIIGTAAKDKTTNLVASVSYQNGTLNSDGTITWSSTQVLADRGVNYGSNSSWNLNLLSTDLGGQGLKKVFVTVIDDSYAEGDPKRSASHSTQVFLTSASTPGGLGGSGLTAWYDPKLSGIAKSGSMTDLSGNNNSLSAGVDADGNSLAPTSAAGGYLSFGAGQYMSLYNSLSPTSLFYVGDIGGSALFYSGSNNTGTGLGFVRNASDASTNPNAFSLSTGGTTVLNNSGTTGLSGTSPYVASASLSGTSLQYSINGNAAGVGSGLTGFTTAIKSIGASSTATSSSIFGEFAAYSTVLSAEQQAVLQNAAAQEYGLAIANDLFAPNSSTSAYGADAAGLIRSSSGLSATSVTNGALTVTNKTLLSSSTGSLFFGNDAATSATAWKTGSDGVTQISRTWALDIRGGATSTGTVDLTFDMATLAQANGVSVSTFLNNVGSRSLSLGFKSSETGAWIALGTAAVDKASGTVTFTDVKVGTNNLRTGFISVLDATTLSYNNGAAAPASAYGTAAFNTASVDVTFSNALGGTPSVSDFTVKGGDNATYGVTGVALKAGTTSTYTLTFSVDGTKAQLYTYSYKATAPHTDADGQKIVSSVGKDGVSDGGTVFVDREPPPVLAVSKPGYLYNNGNDLFQGIGRNTLTVTSGVQLNNTVDLSTDGGLSWTRTDVSSDYGAANTITMPEGKYAAGQLMLRTIDVAGNRTTQSLNPNGWFVVDLTKPTVTFGGFISDAGATQGTVNVGPGGATLTDNTPIFFGNVDNNFFVSETDDPYKPTVTFRSAAGGSISGTMVVGAPNSGSVAGTRKWTFTVTSPLANTSAITGLAQFEMGVSDPAGNVGTGAISPQIRIAYVPPTPSFALANDVGRYNNDFVTNDGKVNVSGIEAGATWEYSVNKGVNWTTGTGSSFTLAALAGSGKYQIGDIQVRQTTASAAVSAVASNTNVIWIDTTPPSSPGSLSFPSGHTDSSNPNSIKIIGSNFIYAYDFDAQTSGGTLRYSLDGGKNWLTSTDGFIYFPQEAFYAKNTIKTQLIDLAGNAGPIGTLTTDLTVTNTPPVAPSLTLPAETGVSLSDGITKNKTVTISGLVSSPMAYWEYSLDGGNNFINGSGTSFDLDDGTYAADQIQVRQSYFGIVSSISSNSAALAIDTAAPEVTWVADKSSLKAGDSTIITFTANEAVSGLEASDFTVSGGTLSALTQSATDPKKYTATFTPAANFKGTATVSLTGVYTDVAGNAGSLNTPVSLTVDTTAPSVSSVVVTATGAQNNYLNAGDVVTVTANFTQSINVTGTPRIALNIGGVTRYATYSGGTGSSALTFTYTIGAGDTDINGISIDANKLELNGASLSALSGNSAVLDHAAVSDIQSLMVDTAAPSLQISASQTSFKAGETATITFTGSESLLGLDASDFSVTNGVLSNFARVGTSNVYTATFTPSASFEGAANITFNGSYTDLAGNAGAAPSSALSFAVDSKAPNAPSIQSVNDDTDPVQGPVANNGLTNDTDLTVKVSLTDTGAVAGDTIQLYSGTSLLGTSYKLSAADITNGYANLQTGTLTNGSTYVITARVIDQAGNQSAASGSTTVTVDTNAPTAPGISSVYDNVDPVQGPVSNNGLTNDTDLTVKVSISGTGAVAGDTIQLYNAANILGASYTLTASDIASGFANVQTGTLVNGSTYVISARVIDQAGNRSAASGSTTVTIDTSAPSAPSISSVTDNVDPVQGAVANNGTTNDTDLTVKVSISGTNAVAGDTIQLYNAANILGSIYTLTAADITNGFANVQTGTLTHGSTYVITARVSDQAGNQSAASGSTTVTIDTSAPAKPVISSINDNVDPVQGLVSKNGYTNDTTPTLTITAESGSVVSVYDGTTLLGIATETATAGVFTFTASSLSDDIHNFTVKATDAAGNVSTVSDTFSVNIDTVAPPAPVLTLSTDSGAKGDDRITNDTTMTMTAQAGTSVVVTYKNGSKTLVKSGYTGGGSTPLVLVLMPQELADLGDGNWTVSAVAKDAAGNLSDAGTASFTVDRTPPTLAFSSAASSLKAGEVATITFTLSEAVTGLDVSDFDVTNGTLGALVQSSTDPKVYTATFTPKDKYIGSAKISFKTTGAYADIAGNVGDAQSVTSGALTFNVDTTAASITTVAVTSASGAQNNYLNQGDTAFVTVTFSEAVTVNATNGTPQLALKIGNVTRYATFDSGSGSSKLVFKYQVGANDTDMNGISLDANSLSLNGGSISTQASGNAVVLAHADVADNASYMVDTTKPDAPVLSRGAGVADGATSAEATASGGVVTLSAELGASVEVKFSNGAISVTKTITGNGTTPVPVTLSADELKTLGDGTISVSANATDLAGNISDAGTTSFTLDTTKPGKPVLTPVPGVEDGATGEEAKRDKGVVTVTADPDTDVTVTFRNGNKEITKTVRGGGTSSVPVILTQADLDALGDGTISVSAVSKDAAGNESDAGTSSFTLDTVAPTISVTSSATALKVGETATLTFEASEELVDLTADDFAVAHGTLSNFVRSSSNPKIYTATFTPDMGFEGQGGVTLKGAFTDKAGNSGSLNSFAEISIDTKAPEVSLVSYDDNVDPQAGNFAVNVPTNDLTPTFNGTGESGAKVELFRRNGSALVSLGTTTVVNGKWSVTPGTDLAEGSYDIFARITDNAGNTSDTANNTLTIDRGTSGTFDGYIDNTVSPPVVSDFATPASATQLSFAGTGEAGATVDLFVRDSKGDTKIGTAKVDPATGKWTLRPTNELIENTYTIFVRVTDKAGNSFDTPTKSLMISIPRVSSAPAEAPVVEPTKAASPTAETSSANKVTDNIVQASFGAPIGSLFDVKTIQSVVVTQDAKPMPRDVTGSVGDEGLGRSQLPAVEYSSYLRPAFVEIGVLVRDTRSGFVAARSEMQQVDAVKVTSRAEFEPWIEDTKTGRILVRRDGPAEIRMQVEITLQDGTVIRQNIRVDSRSGQFEVLPSGNTSVAPQSLDQQLASVLWGDMREVIDLFEEAQL